jgi:hypothetical protein
MNMLPDFEEIQRINYVLSKRSPHFNEYARFSELQLKNYFNVNPQIFWDKGLFERTDDRILGLNQQLLKWSKKGKKLVELADWNQFLEWEEKERAIKAVKMPQAKINIPLPMVKSSGWLSKFFNWVITNIWLLILGVLGSIIGYYYTKGK